jgi:hypothetical protein
MIELRKKPVLIVLSLCAVALLAAVLIYWRRDQPEISHIAPRGGREETPFNFSASPIFLQTDRRWADNEIGGSREPLRAVGCTICAMSMALAHYGIEMSPDQLNEQLKTSNGFTEQGWLKWNTVAAVTGQKVRVDLPEKLSHETIDQALKTSQPVIAKILLGGRIQHWVLIVGKSGQEYLIKDPLGDGETLDHLSKFGSDIFAIRIVTKIS